MRKDNHTKEEERQRYNELLGELRTVIPGVQVLFAFLLTVPFSSRFAEVDRVGKVVFTVSLMAVAAATVLFLGPAAYHRLADRQDRRGRLRYGVGLALAGMALLAAVDLLCGVRRGALHLRRHANRYRIGRRDGGDRGDHLVCGAHHPTLALRRCVEAATRCLRSFSEVPWLALVALPYRHGEHTPSARAESPETVPASTPLTPHLC
jgi:hypothetical protein